VHTTLFDEECKCSTTLISVFSTSVSSNELIKDLVCFLNVLDRKLVDQSRQSDQNHCNLTITSKPIQLEINVENGGTHLDTLRATLRWRNAHIPRTPNTSLKLEINQNSAEVCNVRNGTLLLSTAKAALDSAAPTNPTGKPRITAGLPDPSWSISNNRNRAVGALPMATTAPSRCDGALRGRFTIAIILGLLLAQMI